MVTTAKTDSWRTQKTLDGLRRRYSALHPLLFQRTIERAESAGEAFDLLEGMPIIYPIVWNDQKKQWVTVKDLWLSGKGK